jgi:hypothetical protein
MTRDLGKTEMILRHAQAPFVCNLSRPFGPRQAISMAGQAVGSTFESRRELIPEICELNHESRQIQSVSLNLLFESGNLGGFHVQPSSEVRCALDH